MDNSFKTIVFIMISIVLLAVLAGTILYVKFLPNKNNEPEQAVIVSQETDETVGNIDIIAVETIDDVKTVDTFSDSSVASSSDKVILPKDISSDQSQEEYVNEIIQEDQDRQSSLAASDIRSLVLRYKKAEGRGSFRYEFMISGSDLYFTGWYETEDADVRCSDHKIAMSRLDDVTEILDRYLVAKQIQQYRDDPSSYVQTNDPQGALEIVFVDGNHANFGYPNGAGNALAKYCKTLTEWLSKEN